jgi:hypothetical protein
MRVDHARQIAADWIEAQVRGGLAIDAAFLHGSITWLGDSDLIAPESDVDVLVISRPGCTVLPRAKSEAHGLVLDVAGIEADHMENASSVLGAYHLAGSLRYPESVLYDRSGKLTSLQRDVGLHFSEPHWIRQRVDHALDRIRINLSTLQTAETREERLISWLFAAGVSTHVLLTAGQRNPTVRNRYAAVRTMLDDLGRPEFYPPLLDLVDSQRTEATVVERLVSQLEPLFDVASTTTSPKFHFSDDLSPSGRIGAIDASLHLIAQGHPREALFWLGVTAARAMTLLTAGGAKDECNRFDPLLDELADLFAVGSQQEAATRDNALRTYLPVLRKQADQLIDSTGTK